MYKRQVGPDAADLLAAAGVEADEGFADLATANDAAGFLASCGSLRHWDRDVRP